MNIAKEIQEWEDAIFKHALGKSVPFTHWNYAAQHAQTGEEEPMKHFRDRFIERYGTSIKVFFRDEVYARYPQIGPAIEPMSEVMDMLLGKIGDMIEEPPPWRMITTGEPVTDAKMAAVSDDFAEKFEAMQGQIKFLAGQVGDLKAQNQHRMANEAMLEKKIKKLQLEKEHGSSVDLGGGHVVDAETYDRMKNPTKYLKEKRNY
jgi:hypothetical protein